MISSKWPILLYLKRHSGSQWVNLNIHDFNDSFRYAYYSYQIVEAMHYVAKSPLDKAFLKRYNKLYLVALRPDYQRVEAMLKNCIEIPKHKECISDIQILYEGAMHGLLPTIVYDSHKREHNAIVKATVNVLIAFGRLHHDK